MFITLLSFVDLINLQTGWDRLFRIFQSGDTADQGWAQAYSTFSTLPVIEAASEGIGESSPAPVPSQNPTNPAPIENFAWLLDSDFDLTTVQEGAPESLNESPPIIKDSFSWLIDSDESGMENFDRPVKSLQLRLEIF